MNVSFWERESFLGSADCLIVGAGIVGMSAAIHFKMGWPNKRVIILERCWLSEGASTKNAGFACFGSISELEEDLKTSSEEDIVNLSVRRYRGLSELKSLLGSNEIEFNGCGGVEIFKSKSDLDFYSEKLTKWNNLFLSEFKSDVYSIKKANNFRGLKNIAGAIMNEFEGSLNTGKMIAQMRLKALSLGVEIYNGVNVLWFSHSASGVEINSSAGTWRAEQVIFCVNAFANNFGFQFDIQPKRNQVIVSKEMNHYLEATYHAERGYIYFRPIGKRILIGGMRHLFPQTENTINFGNTDEVITALSDYASEVVVSDDNFEIDMQWSGIIAMGTIKKPIVERINSRIGIAVRMGGMGVAIGTSVGREISTLMMQ